MDFKTPDAIAMIGQVISHYKILEKLGQGGMGVVYMAHDTTLDRDVALKFLAHSLKVNETDQARFLQEARSAALLNHPNICTIHDVLEVDEEAFGGKQSVIVMEYVDGKSLRDMLPVSTMKQATELGIQIANGLAAAHEKGLVHRDIKPENIMVFKGGRAAIMDFGLAKLKGSLSLTRTGTTVGTVKYMSPEQVCGGEVDHRSDIFSLGIVLYELFTGHSPFKGEHEAAVLYEIANGEPPLPATLTPEIPNEIESVILECLAKDPNDRLQSAAEIRRRLAAALVGSKVTTRIEQARASQSTAAEKGVALLPKGTPLRGYLAPWLLAGLLGVALIAFVILYFSRLSPAGVDLSRATLTPIAGEAVDKSQGVFSPDGKSIAYAAGGLKAQLYVKNLAPNAVPVQLTTGRNIETPFWSRRGDLLYFLENNRLWSIGAAGGEPHLLFDSLFTIAATLAPDGNSLYLWADTTAGSGTGDSSPNKIMSLLVSSPPGAPPRMVPASPTEQIFFPVYLRVSPDGSTLGISMIAPEGGTAFWLVPLTDAKNVGAHELLWERPMLLEVPAFDWLPDSRTVVLTFEGNLWFGDTRTGHLRRATFSTANIDYPMVSPDGKKILFISGFDDVDIVEVPLDGSPPRTLIGSSFMEQGPSWSATGERMAYVTNRSGKEAIWIRNQKEDLRAAVTCDQFAGDETLSFQGPEISPDGKRLAYVRVARKAGWQIWVSPSDGGQPVLLMMDALGKPTWSPDGKQIAALTRLPREVRCLIKTVGSSDSARILPGSVNLRTPPVWSAKGNWLAFGIRYADSILLVSSDGKQLRRLKSPVPVMPWMYSLTWKPDESALYILSSTAEESRLDVVNIATGKSTKIAAYDPSVVFNTWNLMLASPLSPDGKSLTTTAVVKKRDIWMLEGFSDPAALW